MSWLTGYAKRKKYTVKVDNLDEAQVGFPLCIGFTADADIGALCRSDGFDIRITAADGVTELPYDRRAFAVAGGEATGLFFVKSNLSTSPATEIYIYYGDADAEDGNNPTAVWDTSFKGVYHLDEAYGTAADNYKDSSAAAHHATLTDADADSGQDDGPAGKCVDLNGDADYLTVADHADHDPGGALTAEIWINSDTIPTGYSSVLAHGRNTDGAEKLKWAIRTESAWGTEGRMKGQVQLTSGNSYTLDAGNASVYGAPTGEWSGQGWACFVMTFDRTLASARLKFYRDGELIASLDAEDADIDAGAYGLTMGSAQPYTGWYFTGLLAEARYSTLARSASWIKFAYHNISAADHELTLGAEEAAPVTATPLELELAKITKELAYLFEIEIGHRIDADTWTQCDAPNTAVFWMDHRAEGEPSRVRECDRSAHSISEYTEADDVADCQATASSWFYDGATGRLYVHTSGGDSPSMAGAYYIMSLFWERIATEILTLDGHRYRPYFDNSSIPDVSLEVSMFSEGGMKQSFGKVNLINADGYFDSRVKAYIYEGKQALLKVIVPGQVYATAVTIWKGWTGNWECTDERLELDTEDERRIAE